MKKLIVFLVVVQMIVVSLYGVVFIRSYISTSLHDKTASISLVFDSDEEYHFFLDLAEEYGLKVTREVYTDEQHLMLYTSDVTGDGKIKVTSGRLPEVGTAEFVSDKKTGEATQVGMIQTIIPDVTLSLSHIENTKNVSLDGIYFIHSTDSETVNQFVDTLAEHIYRAEIFSENNHATIFGRMTPMQIIEFMAISILLFICIVGVAINYAVIQLKVGSVLLVHGHSKFYVIKKTTADLVKLLLIAFVLSYVLTVVYIFINGYVIFLGLLSVAFILSFLGVSFFYLFMFQLCMSIYLLSMNTNRVLKGEKPYLFLQTANYLVKMTFTIAILIFTSLAIGNFIELNNRLQALTDWDLAQNTYQTTTFSVGQSTDPAIDFEVMNNQLALYETLTAEKNAFLMNSQNIFYLEMGHMPYADMSSAPPLTLSPNGYSVTISPNYLNVNPIKAVNGIAIADQINWDSNVLNLLVPEHLAAYEEEILRLYLEEFYYSKVSIDNIYNEDLGFHKNELKEEELSIHIIYVEDNQSYFAFDERVSVENGNRILDPIAIVYTGSVHPSRLSAMMSGGFFFQTDALDAYQDIADLIAAHNLSHVIRSTPSVFDQQGEAITLLRGHLVTAMTLIFILLLSSVAIIYGIMMQYFEKNKKLIFVKAIYGYSFVRRHLRLLLLVSSYYIAIMLILVFFLGKTVVLPWLLLLTADLSLVFLIDKKLTAESFSKITRGGE